MNSFHLRMLAMITMLIDHVGATFFPEEMGLRFIGRIAFILFAFLTAEGMYYTKNKNAYIKRLLLCGVLSEIPFDLMVSGQLFTLEMQNVCFVLALGVIACKLLEERKQRETIVTLLGLGGVLAITYYIPMDYGLAGVISVVIMYYLNHTRKSRVIGAVGSVAVTMLVSPLQVFALLAVPFVYFYNEEQGKRYGYFFYLFYPLHMLIIWLVYIVR